MNKQYMKRGQKSLVLVQMTEKSYCKATMALLYHSHARDASMCKEKKQNAGLFCSKNKNEKEQRCIMRMARDCQQYRYVPSIRKTFIICFHPKISHPYYLFNGHKKHCYICYNAFVFIL